MCSIVRGKTKTPGKTSTHTLNIYIYYVLDSSEVFFPPGNSGGVVSPTCSSGGSGDQCGVLTERQSRIVSSMYLHTRRTCRHRVLRPSIILLYIIIKFTIDLIFVCRAAVLYSYYIYQFIVIIVLLLTCCVCTQV